MQFSFRVASELELPMQIRNGKSRLWSLPIQSHIQDARWKLMLKKNTPFPNLCPIAEMLSIATKRSIPNQSEKMKIVDSPEGESNPRPHFFSQALRRVMVASYYFSPAQNVFVYNNQSNQSASRCIPHIAG